MGDKDGTIAECVYLQMPLRPFLIVPERDSSSLMPEVDKLDLLISVDVRSAFREKFHVDPGPGETRSIRSFAVCSYLL